VGQPPTLPKTNNRALAEAMAKAKGVDDIYQFYAPATTEKRRKLKMRKQAVRAERAKYASTNAWATLPLPNSTKHTARKK
jgi:hypothetical protein